MVYCVFVFQFECKIMKFHNLNCVLHKYVLSMCREWEIIIGNVYYIFNKCIINTESVLVLLMNSYWCAIGITLFCFSSSQLAGDVIGCYSCQSRCPWRPLPAGVRRHSVLACVQVNLTLFFQRYNKQLPLCLFVWESASLCRWPWWCHFLIFIPGDVLSHSSCDANGYQASHRASRCWRRSAVVVLLLGNTTRYWL